MVIETPQSYELLIADDNRSFREILREILEGTPQLRIHDVESGEAAIEYSLEVQIDIVILDMHMHVLTGLETLKELKGLDAIRPCILLSSAVTDELRRDALQADAYSVLNKPVRRAELCATVTDALSVAYNDPDVGTSFSA